MLSLIKRSIEFTAYHLVIKAVDKISKHSIRWEDGMPREKTMSIVSKLIVHRFRFARAHALLATLLLTVALLTACRNNATGDDPDGQTGGDGGITSGSLVVMSDTALSASCRDLAFDGSALWCLGSEEGVHQLDASGAVTQTLYSPGNYPAGLTFDGQSLWVADGSFGTGLVYRLDSAFGSSIPAPEGSTITGLAFNGTNLWAVDTMAMRIHRLDSDGTILASIDCPGDQAGGLTYDGQYLWVAAFDAGQVSLHQLDPASGNVVSSFDVPGLFQGGLTYDGAALWYVSETDDLVQCYDLTGNLLGSFTLPGDHPQDLASDGTHLWLANGDVSPGLDQILQLDTSGTQLSALPCPGSSPGGLTHDGQRLWHADRVTARIYPLTTTGGDVFPLPVDPDFMAHDGNHFWAAADGQLLRFDADGTLLDSVAAPCAEIAGLEATVAGLWVLCDGIPSIGPVHHLDLSGGSIANYATPALIASPLEGGFAFDGSSFWLVASQSLLQPARLYQLQLQTP